MNAAVDPPTHLRVVVTDDQASVREGLAALLDLLPDIEVVATAANGEEALERVGDSHPDAILLDLHMPVLDGIETTRRLVQDHPDVAIVILTTYDDDTSILSALQAGARSYLTKDADRTDIAHALRSAATGLSVLAPDIQATLLAALPQPDRSPEPRLPTTLPDSLTRREAEVLVLIARGRTNREIAAQLYLSPHTVRSHINHIFAKTRSPDRAAAARYAHQHGLA